MNISSPFYSPRILSGKPYPLTGGDIFSKNLIIFTLKLARNLKVL
jgi:hypothetical protein